MKVVTIELMGSAIIGIFFSLVMLSHGYNKDMVLTVGAGAFFITLMILRRVFKMKVVVPLTAIVAIIVLVQNIKN